MRNDMRNDGRSAFPRLMIKISLVLPFINKKGQTQGVGRGATPLPKETKKEKKKRKRKRKKRKRKKIKLTF